MKQFRCGDVIPGCSLEFRGTEEEIIADVTAHAAEDHALPPLTPELLQTVRRAIREADTP